jgi:lactate dehydrogenase-like 2-hydroxyacid dehydrogenase
MTIVFLDAGTIGDVSYLQRLHEFGKVILYDNSTSSEAIRRAEEAEIVLSNKVIIDKELIDNAPSLKLICITATGMNNINVDYAAEKNIIVKNVKNYATESVVQVTFGLMLHLLNKINYYHRYVISGQYSLARSFTHIGPSFWELSGKTIGIIGLGSIGLKTAQTASVFGMKVLYYSTSGKNNNPDYIKSELDPLLIKSDIVSVHAPLNENTQGLITYQKIKLMKAHSLLINTGRGGIIDEHGLLQALDENLIAGAALDVMEKEPIEKSSPLLREKYHEKLLLTPHIGWSSMEARELLMEKTYNTIKAFIQTKSQDC